VGGKRRPARGADNLTAICELIFYKMRELRRLTTLWAFMACYRNSFTFTFYLLVSILMFHASWSLSKRMDTSVANEEEVSQSISKICAVAVGSWFRAFSTVKRHLVEEQFV
jgi:hypothetical protein